MNLQPLTYASLALVFFSCLTIAWTGTLVEVMGGGILGGISGAIVGALFGDGNALATFLGWIVLGIVISILIKVAFLKFALPIFIIVVSSGVGTIIAGLIVKDLGHFYLHHSRTKFKFGAIQGAGVGGAIAGIFGTGYWAVISAAILNASQKVIKNFVNEKFGIYFAILLLLLTAISGASVGIIFKIIGFYHSSVILFVVVVELTLILIHLYSPKK